MTAFAVPAEERVAQHEFADVGDQPADREAAVAALDFAYVKISWEVDHGDAFFAFGARHFPRRASALSGWKEGCPGTLKSPDGLEHAAGFSRFRRLIQTAVMSLERCSTSAANSPKVTLTGGR